MNASQLAKPRLEDIVRRIQGISTLPPIALKIIEIPSDNNSDNFCFFIVSMQKKAK